MSFAAVICEHSKYRTSVSVAMCAYVQIGDGGGATRFEMKL